MAASIAAAALDLLTQNPSAKPFREGRGKLVDDLDAGNTYVALGGQMDYEDYFKSAPKSFVLKAIGEAINEDEARRVSSFKKPELAAFALANVPAKGWLLVELRTSHYLVLALNPPCLPLLDYGTDDDANNDDDNG